jgi:L-2-hydroxyglutarate oxidase LhgO
LHSGFYYSPDSLKAKFCREGNLNLRALARKYEVPISEVGKVVVSKNQDEDSRLEQLHHRGISNGVELEILHSSLLKKYEPLARTNSRFLWSPTTSVSDPSMILGALQREFLALGGKIVAGEKIELRISGEEVVIKDSSFRASRIVNAAGAQADRLSRTIDVGLEYAMLPFMGLYRYVHQADLPLTRLVYPVPHPLNPFLGVHFTLTIDGLVKIGPTAIPVFGREQYSFRQGWSLSDFYQAMLGATALIKGEAHNMGALIREELPNMFQTNLVRKSLDLVPQAEQVKAWRKKSPGIRAQLVHLPTGKLEQDFVVRKHLNSVHVLNAVSPGWTSALPFGRWITENYLTSNLSSP